jgi:hypothetical protein
MIPPDPSLAPDLLASAFGGPAGLTPFVLYFLFVSFVIAVASSAIRESDARRVARESTRFFVAISAGILIFCMLVFFLEWLFVRPLI